MARNHVSLRLRQNTQMQRKDSKKEPHKKMPSQLPTKKTEPVSGGLIYPGGDTAFKALLSARFCAAIWFHISDCDETFNYWEPTHYLVYGKGLQTWEYSPEFALRSYTYLLVHALPAYVNDRLFQPNPLLIFYFIRCLLAVICTFAELYFYKAVCREFGINIGRICFAFQLFSAGMFTSSTAYLPSTLAMYCFAGACAAWWQQIYPFAIFLIALGSLLGWPFAAVLGIPIAYDMIVRKKMYRDFVQWSAISAIAILGPMIFIDSSYYGKIVVAPWNIVKYNVFGGPGSQLYGTEPFSYYIINGFLNFNFIWVLALLSPIIILMSYLLVPAKNKSTLILPLLLSISPLFLWLSIFLFQPHKEERFLFPIYPMICLCGAISLDHLQKLWFRLLCFVKTLPINFFRLQNRTHYLDSTVFILLCTIAMTALCGVSRIFALYQNYHAPLDLMMELNRLNTEGKFVSDSDINLCLGKDWYRFPGSFFLPSKKWNVRFVKSEFKGLLPIPYSEEENGTSIVHSHFNGENREEPSSYFNVSKCNFMLDLDLGRETELEPRYSKRKEWTVLKSLPFLDADRSHRFFRAFYIPYFNERYVRYANFNLLQATKPGRIVK